MFDYHMPLYRPPSEGRNLIFQATLGCSFNQCSFCSMYKSKDYQVRPLEKLFREIDLAAARWPGANRIFLADGDALALPTEHLLQILKRLQTVFPRLSRVSCYATPGNIRRKPHSDLVMLRENRLKLLYLGIESGADLILKKITKGANSRSIAESLLEADAAGLKVSATVILGLGGKKYRLEHIYGTVELLNRAPATYVSTLQLYLEPSVLAEFHEKFGEAFEMQDDWGILEEQERLISRLNPPKPIIFRSNHASNALALAGNLPRDRERLLASIQQVLANREGIRPEFLRGL